MKDWRGCAPTASSAARQVSSISAVDETGDWRLSPFGNPRTEDLSRYRGAAKGPQTDLAPFGKPPFPAGSSLKKLDVVG